MQAPNPANSGFHHQFFSSIHLHPLVTCCQVHVDKWWHLHLLWSFDLFLDRVSVMYLQLSHKYYIFAYSIGPSSGRGHSFHSGNECGPLWPYLRFWKKTLLHTNERLPRLQTPSMGALALPSAGIRNSQQCCMATAWSWDRRGLGATSLKLTFVTLLSDRAAMYHRNKTDKRELSRLNFYWFTWTSILITFTSFSDWWWLCLHLFYCRGFCHTDTEKNTVTNSASEARAKKYHMHQIHWRIMLCCEGKSISDWMFCT